MAPASILQTHSRTTVYLDHDMRFMQGSYIGVDQKLDRFRGEVVEEFALYRLGAISDTISR